MPNTSTFDKDEILNNHVRIDPCETMVGCAEVAIYKTNIAGINQGKFEKLKLQYFKISCFGLIKVEAR